MNKKIILSLVSISAITALNAADDISGMFSEGKVSGQIREFSISRSVDDSRSAKDDYTRNANAIGGHLKFETAELDGLSLGTAFYTTHGFALDDPKDDYTQVDPTLLGVDNDGYSILGEAYVQYKYGNTTFKGGRQKLSTPLANADDVRMIPNLFEAYVLINKDIPDTTLIAAHVTKFAQGTFARAYNGGLLASTGGYSYVDTRNRVGEFLNMGEYAVGESTSGVTIASATYSGIENLKVQLWDYYAYDILNAIYAQADFKWDCLLNNNLKNFASAQIIKEDDIGDKLLKNAGGDGSIDSLYWGLKVGTKYENFTAYIAYSETSSNSDTDTSYQNAIISPWGGIPAFTQGMVTRHMFLAGTKATKIATSYNFKDMGANVKATIYYANYNMDENNGYTEDDANEAGFDIIYYPEAIKNLQLRFRGNFSDDFYVKDSSTDDSLNGTVGWNEYRFIMNYNF
jgi:hypothetical protein